MAKIKPFSGSRSSAATFRGGDQLVGDFTHFEYEARAQPRTKLTIEIVARASNGEGTVFGTPFNAVTTNISSSGIGFLHTTPVMDKFLAITLGAKDRRAFVLVEVVRCRAVGDFYEIGAKFIRLIDSVGS